MQELKRSIVATCKKYSGLQFIAMNTDEDHVHLQIEIPPNTTISDAVKKLKGVSSMAISKKLNSFVTYTSIRKAFGASDILSFQLV